MRKYLILLLLPFMAACGPKGPKEAILAGKFINSVDHKVYVTTKGVTDTVNLDENGGFTYKAMLEKPQLYKLNIARTQTLVYLNPGDSSYVEFDVTAPLDGPTFSADQKNVNQNIFKANKNFKEIMSHWREIYSLNSEDFKVKLDSIEKVMNLMVDSLKGEAKNIVDMEHTRAKYAILNLRINYPEYSSYLSGKEYNPDSVDYSFLDNVDMNNAEHLQFDDYTNLVNTYVDIRLNKMHNMKELSEKSSKERLTVELSAIDSIITNPTVRDYLKMNKLIEEIEYGEFYELNDIVQNYLNNCQTPEYKKIVTAKFEKKMELAPGKPAPVFKYKDINDKEYSLEDFKGKLVYIDFWATWCGPCRHELPELEKLQNDYKGKKIVFVSISLDDNKAAWEKMEKENKMKGVQLYGEGAWKSFAAINYQIYGIPTFFLIDANGNILKPNAPRPSSNEIRPLLDESLAKL